VGEIDDEIVNVAFELRRKPRTTWAVHEAVLDAAMRPSVRREGYVSPNYVAALLRNAGSPYQIDVNTARTILESLAIPCAKPTSGVPEEIRLAVEERWRADFRMNVRAHYGYSRRRPPLQLVPPNKQLRGLLPGDLPYATYARMVREDAQHLIARNAERGSELARTILLALSFNPERGPAEQSYELLKSAPPHVTDARKTALVYRTFNLTAAANRIAYAAELDRVEHLSS
jgi:hypothetical protein